MSAEVKNGYKLTEVGVIPEDWDVPSMGEICLKIQDGTHFSPKSGGRDYLYITSKNIRFGYLDLSSASLIDREQHQSIYRRCDVKKGDLLLTKDGANTGNAALNSLDEEFSLLSSVAFLRFHASKHISGYFLQQFLAPAGQRRMQDAMAGNAITRLTLDKINKLKFPVPPTKAEQEAIAEALSDADALIESLEQLITKKRQIKQGAMQELLTGKKRLPGFNGVWEVKRLGEICEIGMGRTPLRLNSAFWGQGYKWLSIADLRNKIVNESKEEITEIAAAEMQIIPKGTLLMSFKLSIGRLCFAGCDLFTNEAICSFNKPQVDANFLYYILCRTDFSLYGKLAVKGYTLNKESLKLVEIRCPSQNEQKAIATVLSDMDSEIDALEVKLEKAGQLKQGMMHNLLTGKIRLI